MWHPTQPFAAKSSAPRWAPAVGEGSAALVVGDVRVGSVAAELAAGGGSGTRLAIPRRTASVPYAASSAIDLSKT